MSRPVRNTKSPLSILRKVDAGTRSSTAGSVDAATARFRSWPATATTANASRARTETRRSNLLVSGNFPVAIFFHQFDLLAFFLAVALVAEIDRAGANLTLPGERDNHILETAAFRNACRF